MIANHGMEKIEQWLQGLVANMARPPQGGDRDQVLAVAAGQCDIAVINTYYLGAMIQGDDEAQKAAAAKVTLHWPDQQGKGTHINVSGAGVLKGAKNHDNAVKLLEFLVTPETQQWYAEVNNEYPVREDVEASALLKSWGEFRADPLAVQELGSRNAEAVMAMDRAGWK